MLGKREGPRRELEEARQGDQREGGPLRRGGQGPDFREGEGRRPLRRDRGGRGLGGLRPELGRARFYGEVSLPTTRGRRGLEGGPDITQLPQLCVGQSVEELLAHALEMGPVRGFQSGSAGGFQHDVEAPRVVLSALARDEAQALEPVDEPAEAAGTHEDLFRERRHAQAPSPSEAKLYEHVVVVPRQPVRPLEVGVEYTAQASVGPEKPLPGGEFLGREPVG